MSTPTFATARPWAPHPQAAPVNRAIETSIYRSEANGTPFCCGGWHFLFRGIPRKTALRLEIQADIEGIDFPEDRLLCTVALDEIPAAAARSPLDVAKYYLPLIAASGDRVTFGTTLPPLETACPALTFRCTLRWTATGQVAWHLPTITPVETPPSRSNANVAIITGKYGERPKIQSISDNVEFYAALCEAACRDCRPDLLVLPEIALQWGLGGHACESALPIPSPETGVFAKIAARHHCLLALGLLEREAGGAIRNTVALFGRDGDLVGKYWKVHLAADGEDESGILPGDDFTVLDTDIGRLGFNICMDSSAAESSRMVGLNGADFLLLPIMGDHRASRWSPGSPIFQEERWKTIMRTHAMDNQLCLVAARNNAQGSCIIDRKGDILAWNEGDRPYISAVVPAEDTYRTWNNLCFREVNWLQRRPHLYTPFTDRGNHGPYPPLRKS